MPSGVYKRKASRVKAAHPFYQKIQDELIKKEISIMKASEEIGIAPNTLIDYNATEIKMRGYNIKLVAEYLDVTIDYLMSNSIDDEINKLRAEKEKLIDEFINNCNEINNEIKKFKRLKRGDSDVQI